MNKNRMIKNKRIKQNWSEQDVNILMWVVSKYADFNNLNNIETDLVILYIIQNLFHWN